MIKESTLRKYGGSLGTTFPKAMTDRLNLEAGDRVYIIETEQGILMTPYDPEFQHVMEIAAQVSREYQHALRELAR